MKQVYSSGIATSHVMSQLRRPESMNFIYGNVYLRIRLLAMNLEGGESMEISNIMQGIQSWDSGSFTWERNI